MPLIADGGIFQKRLGALPLATYQAGETVLPADSRTGRLLILKEGAVAILKQNIEIARVSEPGAVFGELSILLTRLCLRPTRRVSIRSLCIGRWGVCTCQRRLR